MTGAVRRGDVLRYRLPSFQARIARTRNIVACGLEAMAKPYVAVSGGKDSLIVLSLVAAQRPGVTAIWTDDELEHDEQMDYIPTVCEALGAQLIVKTGTQVHGNWFRSWTDEPFWREPLPGTVVTRESIRVLAPRWGYDGVFLGLRQEEACRRRVHLRVRGPLYRGDAGLWQCNPLSSWTVEDVWAMIAGMELAYNPVYDRLAGIGVIRDEQRVGPLPLSPGWHLRLGWPEMYRRLVARYGQRW